MPCSGDWGEKGKSFSCPAELKEDQNQYAQENLTDLCEVVQEHLKLGLGGIIVVEVIEDRGCYRQLEKLNTKEYQREFFFIQATSSVEIRKVEADQQISSKGTSKYKQETTKTFQSSNSRNHMLNLHHIIYPNQTISWKNQSCKARAYSCTE